MKLELKPIKRDMDDVFPVVARHARWVFVALFLAAFSAGLWEWYRNVYRGEWSEEEKQRYAETAFRETEFREDAFRAAVESVRTLRSSHESDAVVKNDLFRPLPGGTTKADR